jgi:predicted acetyltransferase
VRSIDDLELRPVDPDAFPAYARAVEDAFAFAPNDADVERWRKVTEYDRFLGAYDGDEVVGTAGAFSFDLSLPGGGSAACAGVTVVTVRPDHRRRGLLRRMMAALAEQATQRGERYAALWASESPIYGRFGYGPAIPTLELEVPRVHSGFRVPADVGDVRLVGVEEALASFPALRERAARTRPGMLSRPDAHWQVTLDDPSEHREGGGPRRLALLPDRGYALYRVHPGWDGIASNFTVKLQELVGLDPEATASLYRFVLDTDLAGSLSAPGRPADDPLPHLVADRARVVTRWGSPIYLRLLDLPAALEERAWHGDDRLVLDVADASLPANAGRWALEVTDGVARCTATGDAADLVLDTRELATVHLGGQRLTDLLGAGLVASPTPGAAARFDRLAATPTAPWHTGEF